MPYSDPIQQRAAMARLTEERKRATWLYRALLNAYLNPELSPRLYRMVRAELAWLEERGLPVPTWPTAKERDLTGSGRSTVEMPAVPPWPSKGIEK